ncbi:galactosylceramide sulfotransferase-like isoform X2 [Saccoglossus kowalevskii]
MLNQQHDMLNGWKIPDFHGSNFFKHDSDKLWLQDMFAGKKNFSKQCTTEVQNITFLKIHKTGSSTIQNILMRFGSRNNLKFVLPPRGHHLGYPNYFQKAYMVESSDGLYNIFCHHARFNNEVITNLMPGNTIYMTILRDPASVFESAFTYFLMGKKCNYNLPDRQALEMFLNNPMACYSQLKHATHARNPLFYDFGLETKNFEDSNTVDLSIEIIDRKFPLVMIAEYFEESVILLKDLLCWTWEDMTYFKLNSRNEESINQITDDMRKKIYDWNKADKRLYDYFNWTFWRKIDEYGHERMHDDVLRLRELNEKWKSVCLQSDQVTKKGQGNFKIFQPPGVKINNFLLKPEAERNSVCQNMVMPEPQFTEKLRIKQFPNLAHKIRPNKQHIYPQNKPKF